MKIRNSIITIGCSAVVALILPAARAQLTPADTLLLSTAPQITLALTSFQPPFGAGYDVTLADGSVTENTVPTLQMFSATGILPSTLNLFCVETGQDSTGSVQTYSLVPLQNADMNVQAGSIDSLSGLPVTNADQTTGIGASRASKLSLVYGSEFSGGYDPLTFTIAGSTDRARSALQLAIWQILETDSYSNIATSGGGFTVAGTSGGSTANVLQAIADANAILTNVSVHQSDGTITPLALEAAYSGSYQDFIVPVDSVSNIPEPSAYAAILACAGLVLAVAARRRAASSTLHA